MCTRVRAFFAVARSTMAFPPCASDSYFTRLDDDCCRRVWQLTPPQLSVTRASASADLLQHVSSPDAPCALPAQWARTRDPPTALKIALRRRVHAVDATSDVAAVPSASGDAERSDVVRYCASCDALCDAPGVTALGVAVFQGLTECAAELVQAGARAHVATGPGEMGPALLVVAGGHVDTFRWLRRLIGEVAMYASETTHGMRALHLAALLRRPFIAEDLAEQVPVEELTRAAFDGMTPLHFICAVDAVDADDGTPMFDACLRSLLERLAEAAGSRAFSALVAALRAANAKGETVVMSAQPWAFQTALELLAKYDKGAESPQLPAALRAMLLDDTEQSTGLNWSAAHAAADRNALSIVRDAVVRDPSLAAPLLALRDRAGNGLLHVAAAKGHRGAVGLIVDLHHGATLSASSPAAASPAASPDVSEEAQGVVASLHDALAALAATNLQNETPLHLCCRVFSDTSAMVAALCDAACNAFVDCVDRLDALGSVAAAQQALPAAVATLLATFLNVTDAQQATPLCEAAHSHVAGAKARVLLFAAYSIDEIVRAVACRPDVPLAPPTGLVKRDVADVSGSTASTQFGGAASAVRKVVSLSEIDSAARTSCLSLCSSAIQDVSAFASPAMSPHGGTQSYVDAASPLVVDESSATLQLAQYRHPTLGYTPLMIAAQCGADDMVRELLAVDATAVTAADHDGNTALHCAVYGGFPSIARQLVAFAAAAPLRPPSSPSQVLDKKERQRRDRDMSIAERDAAALAFVQRPNAAGLVAAQCVRAAEGSHVWDGVFELPPSK